MAKLDEASEASATMSGYIVASSSLTTVRLFGIPISIQKAEAKRTYLLCPESCLAAHGHLNLITLKFYSCAVQEEVKGEKGSSGYNCLHDWLQMVK